MFDGEFTWLLSSVFPFFFLWKGEVSEDDDYHWSRANADASFDITFGGALH